MRAVGEIVKRQLSPQLEMVRAALAVCPEATLEEGGIGLREHLYHARVGLDIWLSEDISSYPFDRIVEPEAAELTAPAGDALTKEFLFGFLDRVAERVNALPEEERAYLQTATLRGREFTLLDRCIMQFRPIQHHLGVFNERMRAQGLATVPWKGVGEG